MSDTGSVSRAGGSAFRGARARAVQKEAKGLNNPFLLSLTQNF